MEEPKHTAKKELPGHWSKSAPTEEGMYWLYGEPDFGSLGGNYTGVFPVEKKLHLVRVQRLPNALLAVCDGTFISLRPFDREKRQIGYVGVWQPVVVPALPTDDAVDAVDPV